MSRLQTTRTIYVNTFSYEDKVFARVRDLAYLLGLKQPFEFTQTLRKYSDTIVVSGEYTRAFRGTEDSDRVVFVNLRELLSFLIEGERVHKLLVNKRTELIQELSEMFK